MKYELLAPAGSFSSLVAAVENGADSVYFGLQEFNMRALSKNFKISDLPKIRKICNTVNKNKKVKMYLTLNVIMYDQEKNKLENIIKKIKGKVDAIICWDPLVISLCKKYKIPFHVSTQASISNIESAKFYKKLGAEKIVLARELNLKQVKKISKIMDIECFIHGAMCVSISGRCFTSQFLFNKSANRGECLQPCRRAYTILDDQGNELKVENNKVMSAKDLCTLPFIEKLKKAGIKTFKIEGRNRDPRYVATVVKVYRKALDKKLTKKEIEESLNELEKVYNKELSSGFYLKIPTSDDFSKTENNNATEKKIFVGKITHFFPKINVSTIKLSSELKVGDKVVIIGNITGVIETNIQEMEIENKSIQKAVKGQFVGIKTSSTKPLRKNDEVYVLKER